MRVLVDATTLVALGDIGKLDLLRCLDGDLDIPEEVRKEVTTEPARTNVARFDDSSATVSSEIIVGGARSEARRILNEDELTGDVEIVAIVDNLILRGQNVAVVSDDRRVRTVSRSLGATVTGTIGVVVRAVRELDMTAEEGKNLVRRIDGHGLHMTGELREKAYELIEDAAKENEP